MAALQELVGLCEARNIPLIVFFERMSPGDSNLLLHDVLLHAHGAPVQDMAPWFEGFDPLSLTNSKVDSHPNAEGHRVMAEHMANDIASYLASRSSSTTMANHR